MKKIKRYLTLIGIFAIFNLIISLIYLFTNISYNIISTILLIFYLICFATLGYFIAKNSNKKGIIIGLIVGIVTILVLFSLSLLFNNPISIKIILYYLLVVLCVILGSILAKNTKK